MLVNTWISLRDDAQALVLERLDWDEEANGPYQGVIDEETVDFLSLMGDRANVQSLYKENTAQGRTWTLWNIMLTAVDDASVQSQVSNLISKFPASTLVLGAWHYDDGRQVGTTLLFDTRTVTKTWSILNPDYQPDPELTDFDPRFTLSITGPVEEEFITGFSGTPVYEVIEGQILRILPDQLNPADVPVPATVMVDVNLAMGQAPRVFS